MRIPVISICVAMTMLSTAANAATIRIGYGFTWGGLCYWEALMDTYPDGSYRLYYNTVCERIWISRGARRVTLEQMKAETERSPEALAVARRAPEIARRIIADERRAAGVRNAVPRE